MKLVCSECLKPLHEANCFVYISHEELCSLQQGDHFTIQLWQVEGLNELSQAVLDLQLTLEAIHDSNWSLADYYWMDYCHRLEEDDLRVNAQ